MSVAPVSPSPTLVVIAKGSELVPVPVIPLCVIAVKGT